jgi:hypothetical protein
VPATTDPVVPAATGAVVPSPASSPEDADIAGTGVEAEVAEAIEAVVAEAEAAEAEAVEAEAEAAALPATLPGSAVRNSDHAISARSTVALIISGLLVLLLCIGGAAIGGFFSDVATQDGQDGDPSASAGVTPDGSTTFADGEFVIGTDIKSGTYTTTVPGDSTCSWERASSADGSASSVLDSGVEAPGKAVVVTIKATDEVFRSQGCGTWLPVKT